MAGRSSRPGGSLAGYRIRGARARPRRRGLLGSALHHHQAARTSASRTAAIRSAASPSRSAQRLRLRLFARALHALDRRRALAVGAGHCSVGDASAIGNSFTSASPAAIAASAKRARSITRAGTRLRLEQLRQHFCDRFQSVVEVRPPRIIAAQALHFGVEGTTDHDHRRADPAAMCALQLSPILAVESFQPLIGMDHAVRDVARSLGDVRRIVLRRGGVGAFTVRRPALRAVLRACRSPAVRARDASAGSTRRAQRGQLLSRRGARLETVFEVYALLLATFGGGARLRFVFFGTTVYPIEQTRAVVGLVARAENVRPRFAIDAADRFRGAPRRTCRRASFGESTCAFFLHRTRRRSIIAPSR